MIFLFSKILLSEADASLFLCRFETAGIYSTDAPAKLILQFNSAFLEGLANVCLPAGKSACGKKEA